METPQMKPKREMLAADLPILLLRYFCNWDHDIPNKLRNKIASEITYTTCPDWDNLARAQQKQMIRAQRRCIEYFEYLYALQREGFMFPIDRDTGPYDAIVALDLYKESGKVTPGLIPWTRAKR